MVKRKADYTPEEWEAQKEKNRRKATAHYKRKVASIPNYARDLSRKARAKIYSDPARYSAWLEKNRVQCRNWRNRHGISGQAQKKDALIHIRRELRRDSLYRAVWACIPEGLPVEYKEDIAAEAIVLILTEECRRPSEAVKLGKKRLNKNTSSYGMISLDQPTHDGRSWHDLIADDSQRGHAYA